MNYAVIFDNDGLAVDSELIIMKVASSIIKKYSGKTLTEDIYTPTLGLPVDICIDYYINTFKLPITHKQYANERKALTKKLLVSELTVMPGLMSLLKNLKAEKYHLALASSNFDWYIKFCLKKFSLKPFFEAVVTIEMVKNGKPAPDLFLKAAEILKIPPAQCLVLEDAPAGISAAKNAGMKTIAVKGKFGNKVNYPNPNLIVDSLEKLSPDIIEKIFTNS